MGSGFPSLLPISNHVVYNIKTQLIECIIKFQVRNCGRVVAFLRVHKEIVLIIIVNCKLCVLSEFHYKCLYMLSLKYLAVSILFYVIINAH